MSSGIYKPIHAVLYYIIILIVLFSKSMYKQFAQNNTISAHISKYQNLLFLPLFKPFLKTLTTLKVIIDYKSGWA